MTSDRTLSEALAALTRRATAIHGAHDLEELTDVGLAVAADLSARGASAWLTRRSIVHDWTVAARVGVVAPGVIDAAARLLDARQSDAPCAVMTAETTEPSHHLLVAPIVTNDDVLDAIVSVCDDDSGLGVASYALLTALAAHIDTAHEKLRLQLTVEREAARRHVAVAERDEIAAAFQRSLLPAFLPEIPELDIAALYRPMSSGIGGDFYDVFASRDGSWMVTLGDVCGKGPRAASIASLARHALHSMAMTLVNPSRAMTAVNTMLYEDNDLATSSFVTAMCASFVPRSDGATLIVAIAGHPPPLVLRWDGGLEPMEIGGRPLGLLPDAGIVDVTVELGPGDACILYTDGATDVRTDTKVFGERRLHEVVAACRAMNARAILSSIERAVVDFQRDRVDDDLAAVVVAVPRSGPSQRA